MSLDGYIADETGNFDWPAPDEEVHAFVNDLERPTGTYLYGRRMYEVMVGWESAYGGPDDPPEMRDFAQIWRQADKIVYSTTLDSPSSAKTVIERRFDPNAIRRLKAGADRDLSVGGPELASNAFSAGLIDECDVFIVPVVVGGGNRAFRDSRVELELLGELRFRSGFVYLHYRVAA